MSNIIRDPHGVTLEAFSYTTPPNDSTESPLEFFTKTAFIAFAVALCRLGVEDIIPHPLQIILLIGGGCAAVYTSSTLLRTFTRHIRTTGAVALFAYIALLVLILIALGQIL